jgi:hypothetical protein
LGRHLPQGKAQLEALRGYRLRFRGYNAPRLILTQNGFEVFKAVFIVKKLLFLKKFKKYYYNYSIL